VAFEVFRICESLSAFAGVSVSVYQKSNHLILQSVR
jgi:hypothetical protein